MCLEVQGRSNLFMAIYIYITTITTVLENKLSAPGYIPEHGCNWFIPAIGTGCCWGMISQQSPSRGSHADWEVRGISAFDRKQGSLNTNGCLVAPPVMPNHVGGSFKKRPRENIGHTSL